MTAFFCSCSSEFGLRYSTEYLAAGLVATPPPNGEFPLPFSVEADSRCFAVTLRQFFGMRLGEKLSTTMMAHILCWLWQSKVTRKQKQSLQGLRSGLIILMMTSSVWLCTHGSDPCGG